LEGKLYKVYGYKGKQVRDNIHAYDVAQFMVQFIRQPRCGEVYNLGGGRGNSISMLEAFKMAESVSGKRMNYEYCEQNRKGDHICYISNLAKIKSHFPKWDITRGLPQIFEEIANANRSRTAPVAAPVGAT
jgi:CDP-paratose 2-epimerase